MICSYFVRFLVEGVGRNWCQSSVFYLASSQTCGRGLLVNSQKLIFYIGNPTYMSGFNLVVSYSYMHNAPIRIYTYSIIHYRPDFSVSLYSKTVVDPLPTSMKWIFKSYIPGRLDKRVLDKFTAIALAILVTPARKNDCCELIVQPKLYQYLATLIRVTGYSCTAVIFLENYRGIPGKYRYVITYVDVVN